MSGSFGRRVNLGISFTGIVLFLVSLRGLNWDDLWQKLTEIGYLNEAVVVILVALPIITIARVMSVLLVSAGKAVCFRQLVEFQAVRLFYNIVAPGPSVAGDLFEARLLQNRCGGNYSEYVGLVFFERFLRTIVSLFFIIPALLVLLRRRAGILTDATVFGLWGIIAGLIVLAVLYQQQKKPLLLLLRRFLSRNGQEGLARFEESFVYFFRLPWRQRGSLSFWSGVVCCSFLVRIGFVFFLCTGQFNWWVIGFIYTVESLATLFPTPGSVGFFESSQIVSFKLLGYGTDAGLLFCLAYRTGQLATSLCSLPVIARARLIANERQDLVSK